jgi:hypothetical protein
MQPPPRSDDSSEVIPVPPVASGCFALRQRRRWRGLVAVAFFAVILVLLLTFILENTAGGRQLLRRSRHLPGTGATPRLA